METTMMHTTQALYDELRATLSEIDKQIEVIKTTTRQFPYDVEPVDADQIYKWRNTDGKPVLSDMLLARANTLSGMAALKVADAGNRGPGRGRAW
jgi:hypothetical protein